MVVAVTGRLDPRPTSPGSFLRHSGIRGLHYSYDVVVVVVDSRGGGYGVGPTRDRRH